MRLSCTTARLVLLFWSWAAISAAAAENSPRRIVFLPGTKSHGPGHHEYARGLVLLKAALERSPLAEQLECEIHYHGWPQDDRALDHADCLVLFSDGSDRDPAAHPLLQPERLAKLDELAARGVGVVALHYTLFVPRDLAGERFLDWLGGYFDYESGPGENHWYSAIGTHTTTCTPHAQHPVCRGLAPFELREEYYYRMRFRQDDPRRVPLLTTPIPGEQQPQTVAWAVERGDGGRGFAFTGGHFHDNWGVEGFRKLVLNAIVWAAGLEVPASGVESSLPPAALSIDGPPPEEVDAGPLRTLILTGHNHPAHDWRATTAALQDVLSADPRQRITVLIEPRTLTAEGLAEFDVVVQNYVNWEQDELPAEAQQALLNYVSGGGGLAVIHFANGAFRNWPAYRDLVRRVWLDGKSGHDAYGPFRVQITERDHPITRGLAAFETTDELYYAQQGERHIEPLAVARSNVTGQDEPMAFAYRFGAGRVFQTVLGHDAPAIRNAGTAELIRRGCAWAANRSQLAAAQAAEQAQHARAAHDQQHAPGRSQDQPPGRSQDDAPDPGQDGASGRNQDEAPRRSEDQAPGGHPLGDLHTGRDADQVHRTDDELRRRTAPGRFERALDARAGHATAAGRPAYQDPPLTVECWVRTASKAGFNVFVASSPKESKTHWELYSYAGSGRFSVYLPGYTPAEIVSDVDITDDRWHYLAMVWEPDRVRLFVDGQQVHEATLQPAHDNRRAGPLWLGGYPPQSIGCAGLVDEVRISHIARPIQGIPDAPFHVDEHTVGLWHLDELGPSGFEDAAAGNHAWPAAGLREGSGYEPNDPELRAVVIDRSETESFLSLRCDGEGRLFVGGREALFVYEPDPQGAYLPRQELYRFPPHSWLSDIEIRGDDLYVMTEAAIYLLPGARVKRSGIEAQRLIWGWPVDLHVTLHGLAWGPEGDLYFAAGDPLLNYGDFDRPDHWGHWTVFSQPAGTRTPYTGQGGVFRCRPDGSRFEVLARGLRGPDGLAFDRDWNLFTNDNDHESLAASYSPARLLHVPPHVELGWPRGWMPQITPDRADLVDVVSDAMTRGVPVGQAYYDEPYFLPARYRHNLLVARWDARSLTRYPLQPHGASFKAVEIPVLVGRGNARPVGVCVGRGGRIFAAIAYMAQNEGSPTYPSDLVMLTRADDFEHFPFQRHRVREQSTSSLWEDLQSPSWSRRQRAHLELLRRGGDLWQQAAWVILAEPPAETAIPHALWLAAVPPTPKGRGLLISQAVPAARLEHWRQLDPEVAYWLPLYPRPPQGRFRWQALRVLARHPELEAPREVFVEALSDPDPRVQLVAVQALIERPGPVPEALIAGPARSTDSFLRQAAALLLSQQASLQELRALRRANDPRVRLAAALAAGFRLTMPPATEPLPQGLALAYHSQNAMFTVPYAGETVDLKALGPVGSYTIAERWHALPHTDEQEALFATLVGLLSDPNDQVRLQAAHFLSLLRDDRSEPLVHEARLNTQRGRLHQAALASPDAAWVLGPFDDAGSGLQAAHAPDGAPVDLAAEISAGTKPSAEHDAKHEPLRWTRLAAQPELDLRPFTAPDGSASCYIYLRCQSRQPQQALLSLEPQQPTRAWLNGRQLDHDLPLVLHLEPGTNELLLRVAPPEHAAQLVLLLRAPAQLIWDLPERPVVSSLSERLRQAATGPAPQQVPPEFLDRDWAAEARQGNAHEGRRLFGRDGLGCIKCHAISPNQTAAGGPSLANAARRFTIDHLVESILAPSRQVAPLFRATSIETTDGSLLTGLVVSEDSDRVELLLPDATRRTISLADIERRELSQLSPMPSGLVRTPAELRDLLAYLVSENPVPP